jgi:hypothetical protein
MANYVSNWIGVSGTKEDIEAFVAKASKPYTTFWQSGEETETQEQIDCGFAFWNFVRPADEDLDYYFGRKKDEMPEGFDTWSDKEKMEHRLTFSGKNAYDWNIRNWGISHDIWDLTNPAEIEVSADEKTASINYSFETKWAIPEHAFRAMVEQHPELSFDIESEEEQGWGATYSGENGKFEMTEEWDIPDSHADHAKRDRSCNCEWDDDPHDWYDDCPTQTEALKEHHADFGFDNCECEGMVEEPNLIY